MKKVSDTVSKVAIPLTDRQRKEVEFLAAMTDEDIDTSDIEVTSAGQFNEGIRGKIAKPTKKPISLRLDADLIQWLKRDGQGYQTRANQILREQMSAPAKPSGNVAIIEPVPSFTGQTNKQAVSCEVDHLAQESLEWAKTHIAKFGDTDIFPVPFEYKAIAHDWNSIKPALLSRDLSSHTLGADRRVFVVKPGGGFRAATQLDPLDNVLYTAMACEYAPLVEKTRAPSRLKVACSYRFDVTAEGNLYKGDTGWNDYHDQSKHLATQDKFTHVLVADIADFYNRLGHHRVQNSLEMAGVDLQRSRNIEKFLSGLTAKQSQGVPVGPPASIVLAEACLIDVDQFLMKLGVSHTRYVDDFRIFCTSRREAINTRLQLSEYLFTSHRLSLESSKSSIYTRRRFIEKELNDPKEQEDNAKVKALNAMYEALAAEHGMYWYEHVDEESTDTFDSSAEKESFVELFQHCVEKTPLHLGLARYLVRKATKQRSVILNDIVFRNLETLAPVMRDVVNYLVPTISKRNPLRRGKELMKFAIGSDLGDLPFVQMWIIDLLCRRPDLVSAEEALAYARRVEPTLGRRPMAMLSIAYKQIDWIRSKKETWRNHEPWDRRAILWGMSILPAGERRPFLAMVIEQGDILDKAVAKWVLSSDA